MRVKLLRQKREVPEPPHLRASCVVLFANFLLIAAVATSSSVARAAVIRAGVSVVDITPVTGIASYRMSGYFRERINTGVNDPLLAKAVVFEQGGVKAALIFCDLVGIPLHVSGPARSLIERETGIPASNIAIAATHSHTGPLYFGALHGHFHRGAIREQGRDPYEILDYSQELIGRVLRAAMEAHAALRPVELAAGYAREDRLSFNRRFHMHNGTVRFNPGQLNPNIVRPAGPIDPEVGLVNLTAVEHLTPQAAIVSFALHLDTVGGTEYSADFPRYVQDYLRRRHGDGFVSLFGAGACGDINHVDVSVRGRRSTEQIGTMLAQSIDERLDSLDPIDEPSLAVRTAKVNAKLQSYSPQEVEAARRMMNRVADGSVPFLRRVEAYKIMALQWRGGSTIPLEVQVFRISPEAAIVTLPGEVFVELGIAIKEASPFETTLVIELANDAPGYIPTRRAFAEGSYETVNSRVDPGSGEQMVDTAVRLLRELGASPETANAE